MIEVCSSAAPAIGLVNSGEIRIISASSSVETTDRAGQSVCRPARTKFQAEGNHDMETLIAILGIVLTVVLSGPAIAWIVRLWRDAKSRHRWSADLQVERGIITTRDHYAFEFWTHHIAVDAAGAATHTIDARIVNVGSNLLTHVDFPIYCDAQDVSDECIHAWARCGRRDLPVKIMDWVPQRARGRVRVTFDPSVAPAGRCRLRWGYVLPSTFLPGDEYYNWDISAPHYEIGGDIHFSPEWSISYVRYAEGLESSQPKPTGNDNTISWRSKFPRMAKRIRLEFGLQRRGGAPQGRVVDTASGAPAQLDH